ncbi:TetR/AcrR family transcriptional regulator [Demequina sp. NBRC 110057]|uniref:TetR/AcrR family transcriptional regulator n=1 Tax=Demequina sp. NBRC 110057 TaxID=1570346 RepID=UPI000A06DC9F|nr:TetR/AcrR family transcriptional regulator [Demequina sp. NBRC 110057]
MTNVPGPRGGVAAGRVNRAALIAAARIEFEERGIDAPLSAIAKRAGVGQGSLYRHFPDRVALAVAAFEENIEEIEALGASGAPSLRAVTDLVTHQVEGATALIQLIATERADARVEHIADRLRAVVAAAWEASDAEAPDGVTADDVMLAISMVATAVSLSPSADRHRIAERAWSLLGPGIGQAAPVAARGGEA